MSSSELVSIQRKQFDNLPVAEAELLTFLKTRGHSDLVSVKLSPKPESLNSINGLVRLEDGSTLFFKTHTEEKEELTEYYNSELLKEFDYPVISPKKVRTTPGEQIAFYEVITHNTLFDLVKSEEDKNYSAFSSLGKQLIKSQVDLDQKTLSIYLDTLETLSGEGNLKQPIHQLFAARLSENGRYGSYYSNHFIDFGDSTIVFEELEKLKWVINGVSYRETLAELVLNARSQLDPSQSTLSVIGHGDAHNGNIFYSQTEGKFYYFDAAFAGRHSPLLDLAKPIFHNIFARWMYFPDEINKEVNCRVRISGEKIVVENTFEPSSLRREFLRSKLSNVLRPISDVLFEQGISKQSQVKFLKSALLCCPLLTVNLAAQSKPNGTLAERYSEISRTLGFCLAVQLAAEKFSGANPLQELIESIWESITDE